MKTPHQNKILVVLPAFNEEGKIGQVVEKVKRVGLVDAIIVADDCSTDGTYDEARRAGAVVIRHDKNMGVGAGIRSGIDYGRKNGFDICLILSGDDQHDPREIERVAGPILNDEYDFIQGSRWIDGGRVVNERLFRKYTTRWYALFFTILTGRRITDATNGFRAIRTELLEDKEIQLRQPWFKQYEVESYLLAKAILLGYRVIEKPVSKIYPAEGVYTKMTAFSGWWSHFKPIVYLSLGLKR